MKTKLINIFAGPGAGKSTTAAGIFYKMKLAGKSVELVREYIKDFAYVESAPPDNLYLLAKQAKREKCLYGKVDWIVTDSPLELSGYYGKSENLLKAALAYHSELEVHNFLIRRHKKYWKVGRWQTEEEARAIDTGLKEMLEIYGIPYSVVMSSDEKRVDEILSLTGALL